MQDPDTLPPDRLLDLGGETVLVTGASGNIGGAIATRLAAAGARVILHCHRNRRFAEALAAKLDAAAVVQADLADAQSVDAALSSHTPTMVVNNAAAQPVTPLAAMTPSDWREVLTANLDSAFLVTRRAAETFGERALRQQQGRADHVHPGGGARIRAARHSRQLGIARAHRPRGPRARLARGRRALETARSTGQARDSQ